MSIISIIVLLYGTIIGFFTGVIGTEGDSQEYTYNINPLSDKSKLFRVSKSNKLSIVCVLLASPVGFVGIPLLYFVLCILFACFGINIHILNDNIWNIIGPFLVIYLVSLLIGYGIGCYYANKEISKLLKKYSHEE